MSHRKTITFALIFILGNFIVYKVFGQVPVYKDASYPVEQRIEDLLSRMTLKEKVGQMNIPCVYKKRIGWGIEVGEISLHTKMTEEERLTQMEGCRKFTRGNHNDQIGPGGGFFTLADRIIYEGTQKQAGFFNELQEIAVKETRLGIPLLQIEEGTHGFMAAGGTVFPEGLAIGASWNMDLVGQIYGAIAKEGRTTGTHMLCTIVIEPNRDPRLGRNQEGFSEDPYMCSVIAGNIVNSMQGYDVSAKDKIITALTHYPGQSEPLSGLERGAMEISEGNGLQAGAAKIKITPEIPIPMSGYGGRKGPFKGVREDIYARAVVVSDGENKAAILSAEVIGFSNSFWEECTGLITKETGIPVENIFLSAVHSHSGPVTSVYNREESADVSAFVKALQTKLVEITKTAIENLSPASIGVGKGECLMNINRVAPDGKGGITLGRNPYGACDHEVGVVRIDDTSGNPIAVLVNWPCHAVVLGPKNYYITGDWPGAASRYLEEHFGEDVVVPMIIGASGDINPLYGPHIDFEITSSYSFGKDAIGEDLGKETVRVFNNIQTTNTGKISALQRIISLPAKEREGNYQQPESMKNNTLEVRLSALKIGGIVLTGVSGEVFNQVSVKMREQSPYSNTFMVTHCNGSSGYLVTDEAYEIGGYEANSTRAKSGAEEGIIENLLEMINEL